MDGAIKIEDGAYPRPPKITKYMVISAECTSDLMVDVESLCERNWQPLGGVSVTMGKRADGGRRECYHQAMVVWE